MPNATSNTTLSWFENSGSGGFTAQSFSEPVSAAAITTIDTGDIDDDGDSDVVTATHIIGGGPGIVWHEKLPIVSVNDVVVTEGKAAKFTITASGAVNQPIDIDVTTTSQDAADGSDYTTSSGTVTIPAGERSVTFSVPTRQDNRDEEREAFDLLLSNQTFSSLGDSSGTAVIIDDDAQPVLNIADVAKNEGNSRTGSVKVTLTLRPASGRTVGVSFSTFEGTADSPTDFRKTTGDVLFRPGVTSRSISIPVNGDTVKEKNEKFTVGLQNPVHATVADGIAQVTLINDD